MLLTTGQAAAELGMAITTFRRLTRANLIPGTTSKGVRVVVPLEAVQALATRNRAPLHGLGVREIAVLRVEPAKPSDTQHAGDDSPGSGFSADLDEQAVLHRLAGWWRCDARSVAAGRVIPVTVAGYVVAVLTGLQHWENNGRGRHRFPDMQLAGYVTDLVSPTIHVTAMTTEDRNAAELLLATRLPSESGGPIAYVSTHHPDLEGS
ncbi:helix-turn-helix domain-containing protein [Streptomyces bacillaris]|uniref:helix-turn-helix domain-containing protein n=1 Tax=Streptomyces bacillaris TaxID=68179 RepID=UPI0036F6A137